ncbi:MAG: CAP domain-containing protein [Acidimicrobiales bacterium]
MRRRALAVVGIVATAAALTLPLARPALAADATAEAQFVELINQERAGLGLGALAVRPELVTMARNWTDDMSLLGSLLHNPLMAALAPSGWQRLAENVGYGGGVATLHQAFMNSPGHKANVLGDFNQLGVGVSRVGTTMWVTVNFMKSNWAPAAPVAATPQATEAETATGPSGGVAGYWVLGADGGIFSYGAAPFHGSVPGLGLEVTSVLMAATPDQGGYWILGTDGGIFTFGEAGYHGSVPGLGLGSPVTALDLKPTVTGRGYWILGTDGGIFTFGDAEFFGSLPGIGVVNRAVKLVPTPTGRGYWILGTDGGIFTFGDAGFHGSVPGLKLGAGNPSISMTATPTGRGYWILGADGGIFTFGDAGFHGSVPGLGVSARGAQIAATPTGGGYFVLSGGGRVFRFGDAPWFGAPASFGITAKDLAVVEGS